MSVTLFETCDRLAYRNSVRQTVQSLARLGLNPFRHLHSKITDIGDGSIRYQVRVSDVAFTLIRTRRPLDCTQWLVPVVSSANGRVHVIPVIAAARYELEGRARIVAWTR